MKLLFDENLSPRLVRDLAPHFPQCQHVDDAGLRGKSDAVIWRYARRHDLALVSKDNDFRQLSFLHGAPPKVIWLSVGNAGTAAITTLLKESQKEIATFCASPEDSLLVLTHQDIHH